MFDMGEEHIKDSISSTGKKWRLKTNRRVIKINPITQKTSEPGWGGLWGREGVHPGRGPNGNNLAKAKSRSHS